MHKRTVNLGTGGNLDIDASRQFMGKHKDQIIGLFLYYQLIEMLLFVKLDLPTFCDLKSGTIALEQLNKRFNSKTLGILKSSYLRKFPKDKYKLKSSLESVMLQRNSFMHSLWIFIASVGGDEAKVEKVGKTVLSDFQKRAHALMNKIAKLPS